eukprot:12130013-Ditylum_brightwellii.AAC.1
MCMELSEHENGAIGSGQKCKILNGCIMGEKWEKGNDENAKDKKDHGSAILIECGRIIEVKDRPGNLFVVIGLGDKFHGK